MAMNEISNLTIDRQLDAMKNKRFKLDDVISGEYEAKIEELLDLVKKEREKFENLSDLDRLVGVMIDKKVPGSAQARNYGDDRFFDEKKETRKLTVKKAKELMALVDDDYEKALQIVNTMS